MHAKVANGILLTEYPTSMSPRSLSSFVVLPVNARQEKNYCLQTKSHTMNAMAFYQSILARKYFGINNELIFCVCSSRVAKVHPLCTKCLNSDFALSLIKV